METEKGLIGPCILRGALQKLDIFDLYIRLNSVLKVELNDMLQDRARRNIQV